MIYCSDANHDEVPSARSHCEGIEQDCCGLIRISHSHIPDLGASRPGIRDIYRNRDGIGILHLGGNHLWRWPLPALKGHNRAALETRAADGDDHCGVGLCANRVDGLYGKRWCRSDCEGHGWRWNYG